MRLSSLNESMEQTREIIRDKYYWVSDEVGDDVASDTTDELYYEWVVKQIHNKVIRWPEDRKRTQEAYSYYLTNKRTATYQESLRNNGIEQPKNILTYELRDIENLYPKEAEKEESQSERSKNRQIKAEGSSVFYDGPEGKIIKITSPEAMVLYAKNTKWCVSNEEVAKGYLKRGPLYLFIINDQKFLFDCSNWDIQLMDVQDIEHKDERIDRLIINSDLISYDPKTILGLSKHYHDVKPTNDALTNYHYASTVKKNRWLDAEDIIKNEPLSAYLYACDVVNDRWIEAEDTILQDPNNAYYYVKYAVKKRIPKIENVIKTDAKAAYYYALDILKAPWPEAEGVIGKVPEYAYQYAKDVLKGRFPAGEDAIDGSYWKNLYKNLL